MIILTDVATKLEELLNSYTSDFIFVVKSDGYHLDSIADPKSGRNFIPVFVSMVGGEYNPVPNLKEANYTYAVSIYFPVRFKESFYALFENIEDSFIAKKITFGSQTALCNISPFETGEIVGIEVSRFKSWIEEEFTDQNHTYKFFEKEQEVCEEYMSMTFRIFCTTLGNGFMFGNDVKISLSFDTYTLLNPTFDNASIQSNSEEDGEQILDAVNKEISGAPQITSYNNSFILYYDNSIFCQQLLSKWCDGKSQDLEITVKYTFREADTTVTPNITEIAFIRTCYLKTVALTITKGEPVTFTLSFAKKV